MYPQILLQVTCTTLGTIAGLIGSGYSPYFPIWAGTATGLSVGCGISIFQWLAHEPKPEKIIN